MCLLRMLEIGAILDAFNSQAHTLLAFANLMKELRLVQEDLDNDQTRSLNKQFKDSVLQKIKVQLEHGWLTDE